MTEEGAACSIDRSTALDLLYKLTVQQVPLGTPRT